MSLLNHFRMLARYNSAANERLFAVCRQLSAIDLYSSRQSSFGSIHGLLNHVLLGDRIWLARFKGGGEVTPPLNTILYEEFEALRTARAEQDELIVKFFDEADDELMSRSFPYVNNQGKPYVEEASVAIAHFFNHQTHHRGQIHTLVAQSGLKSPSLDLHRIVNP